MIAHSRKLISSLAAVAAIAVVSSGLGFAAPARDSEVTQSAKPKPPVTQVCDWAVYTACMAEGGGSTPGPTAAQCRARSGCGGLHEN